MLEETIVKDQAGIVIVAAPRGQGLTSMMYGVLSMVPTTFAPSSTPRSSPPITR